MAASFRGCPGPRETPERDRRACLYDEALATHEAAIERLARGYEVDPDLRRDLVQDIHEQLWRSLARFDGRCSLRTWVYRVAHNVAVSHAVAGRRASERTGRDVTSAGDDGCGRMAMAAPGDVPDPGADPERTVAARRLLDRLLAEIRALKPLDRQVILLALEDLDAATIGEITGLTPGAVATRLHRTRKALMARLSDVAGEDDNSRQGE